MLFTLKVPIQDKQIRPSSLQTSLKTTLDHYRNIPTQLIGYYITQLLFISQYSKALINAFTLPPLHGILITLYIPPLLINAPMSLRLILVIAVFSYIFSQVQALFCTLCGYIMPLQDTLDSKSADFQPYKSTKLFIGIFWKLADNAQ